MVLISTFTAPTEGLKHQQPAVRVVFKDKDVGKGFLYINEQVLAWQSDSDPNLGFSIEYPHISLHALSRDPATFPHPCIFLMLDGLAQLPGFPEEPSQQDVENGDDSDAESEIQITEVRLVPDDVESLETIFNAIRVCQELNPDPMDSVSEEEEYFDGEYFGGVGDNEDYMEPDTDRMNQLNLNGGGDAPAFEDAD